MYNNYIDNDNIFNIFISRAVVNKSDPLNSEPKIHIIKKDYNKMFIKITNSFNEIDDLIIVCLYFIFYFLKLNPLISSNDKF